jgi:hypothetical protein
LTECEDNKAIFQYGFSTRTASINFFFHGTTTDMQHNDARETVMIMKQTDKQRLKKTSHKCTNMVAIPDYITIIKINNSSMIMSVHKRLAVAAIIIIAFCRNITAQFQFHMLPLPALVFSLILSRS